MYDLFISYSHAADRRLAPILKSSIQRFAKPFYRMRARSVYLDQTNLEASPELWPEIEKAIDKQNYDEHYPFGGWAGVFQARKDGAGE